MHWLPIRAAALLAAAPALLAQTPEIPERPAIWREVTGVVHHPNVTPQYTRPHMPAVRVTRDGRLGVFIEGDTPRFTLLKPEQMTQPFLLNPAGSFTMSSITAEEAWLDGFPNPNATRAEFTNNGKLASHVCLWDDQPAYASDAGQDIYDLTIMVTANTGVHPNRQTQFFTTPVRVIVDQPKTPQARIVSVQKTGTPVNGPTFPFIASAFEPVVCGDGRLLIVRVASPSMPWSEPVTGTPRTAQGVDVVYSYYQGGTVATASGWTDLIPISYAHLDTRINKQFGFAKYPMRDASGFEIPDGEDIGGSYPWIDRDAKNLVIEAISDRLRENTSNRYTERTVPGDPQAQYGPEDPGKHQGLTIVGLWTHGKMVQIDNLNNDMDYAIGHTPIGPQQRLVELFLDDHRAAAPNAIELLLGYGRATTLMPPGENDNGNIIDSLENRLNYREHFRPITLRDIVWPLANCKQTDEVAFDDYVDPDALLVVNMTGLLTLPANHAQSSGQNPLVHHSGWSNTSNSFISANIKLQNAATALPSRWTVPSHGNVIGDGRLEPAATGGVHGKGFWLEPGIGLSFDIADQPALQDMYAHDWYVGLFVDRRFPDDEIDRRLLTFPDLSSVWLHGRSQVVFRSAAGVASRRITLPALLEDSRPDWAQSTDPVMDAGWTHFALRIRNAGHDVALLLNGMPFAHWSDPTEQLFRITAGTFAVGAVQSTQNDGISGWIDDLVVLAHDVDPETAANHAGGTILGLPAGYAGTWKTGFADHFPARSHAELAAFLANQGETSQPAYAVFHDYLQDRGVHRQNIPAGTVSERDAIHFPEGPLFHDAPRPHSTQNRFCISCHHAAGDFGLDLDAITLDRTKTATTDPRRQPSQPPGLVFGRIPKGLVDSTTLPATAMSTPMGGSPIDPWMLPSWSGPAKVQTFTLVDGHTGEDLLQLTHGATIDPAVLGTDLLEIRANLDSAQGSVTFQVDGVQTSLLGVPPFTAFGTHSDPVQGTVFTPGSHTVVATPQGGTAAQIVFTVVGGSPRVVADYTDDFAPVSPAPGWIYAWNALGPVTDPAARRHLNWLPGSDRYTAEALEFPESTTPAGPFVSLRATHGHPGRGSSQPGSGGIDRFALAGYVVRKAGFYKLDQGAVVGSAGGNGGTLRVDVETAGSLTNVHLVNYAAGGIARLQALSLGQLAAGSIIWVGVGPNGSDTNDSFQIDYSVRFNETAF